MDRNVQIRSENKETRQFFNVDKRGQQMEPSLSHTKELIIHFDLIVVQEEEMD